MAAEQILVNGVTEIIKKILPVISQQISSAWGVKDDLRKLKDTLESIQALIYDAEMKQVHDAAVGLWLRRLKDVVYDADDVIDEFSYRNMRSNKQKVQALVLSSNPLVFRFKMASKIRAINQRLDEIFKNSKRFRLQNTGTSQENQTREQLELIKKRNRLTSSDVDDSVLLGREVEKSKIINLLIQEKPLPSVSSSSSGISSQQQNVSALSIVGMGGLGKTTIAQMVYKDDSIVRNFELRAWVCVSDPFDIFKILKDIIESITGNKCEDLSNVDARAKQVKEKLIGKKYLLVLDDLWNDNVTNWEKLKTYLSYGGSGSKILVTTRSRKVASVVGGRIHHLEKLSDDDCWSIIEKKILSLGGAVLTDPEMIDIGKHIAEKCDGLPLAANLLGSSMCSKREKSYWLSIVDDISRLGGTSEHKNVISILKLSYDNLPSPLKQCFSYCCVFPKDWEIEREMLIRLWMAEGFLLLSVGGENISLEEIGNEYFEYLVWSSLFQDFKRSKKWGNIKTCKMHDLVHDLALSVLDCNEFGIAKVKDGKEEVSDVRRLQLQFDGGRRMTSPNVLLNAMKLRTIIAVQPEKISHVNSFFRHKRLRILCLLGVWDRCSLSRGFEFRHAVRQICFASPISQVKHLRYIDLSNIDLSREVSLSHSYNLQTLILSGCRNVPSRFVSKIGSLKSLRHLDISYSDIKFIPENIGSLEHLCCLDLSSTRISKLPDSITRISSLKILKFDWSDLDALPRELGELTRLRCLDLEGTSIKVLPESCITNLCNLEIVRLGWKCELPKEIKNWTKLRIFTYDGWNDVMPRGMENLTSLEELDYVASRSGIEELGGLNSLKVLGITNLENVKGGKEGAETAKLKDKQHLRELNLYWGINDNDDDDDDDDDEVRNSRSVNVVFAGLQPHSNLKKLRLEGFSGFNYPKWMMGYSKLTNCLPNLVELNLINCDQLPALGMLPFLRVLKIVGMKSIKCLGEEFYYQQENQDEEEESISSTKMSSSLFPSLLELVIELENLEEWVAPPLSSTTSCFPSLESLKMIDCKRLRTAPITCFSYLKELKLEGTDDNAVNSFFNRGGGLTSLTEIHIRESPDLIYLPPLGVLLQHNTPNLQLLYIYLCSSFQGFRDEDLRNNSNNINSLRSLWLINCTVLTSLPDLRLFTCIQSLYLQDCPGLTSLPDLRLCTSLRNLTIHKCDKLNKKSIPYDLKKSLTFLDVLKVDFIQRDEGGPDASNWWELSNLMEKE